MNNTNFFMPTKLIIGENSVKENSDIFSSFGKSCMIITAKNSAKKSGALDDVLAVLVKEDISYFIFDEVTQNPYLSTCTKAANIIKFKKVDFLIGIGGGSPLDATKAIAILATNNLPDNTIFSGSWQNQALPFILVGTTSGTGSEVTQYSVITDDITASKRSISSPQCFAKVSFGDPQYTTMLSKKFTNSTAIDALTHCIEGYFNKKSDCISDMVSLSGISIIINVLIKIKNEKLEDLTIEQRHELYLASIYGGITIARTGTCYCHSLGYYLTEKHNVPHGFACGAFLPGFINWSKKIMPDKAKILENYIGLTLEQLCEIITSLNDVEPIKLADDVTSMLAQKYAQTNNFKNTPGNFDAIEAKKILMSLFS